MMARFLVLLAVGLGFAFSQTNPDTLTHDSTATEKSTSLLPTLTGPEAKGVKSLGEFPSLAVLHDGRVKPLDTFARHLLLQWSGRQALKGRAAIEVLAEILFAPEKTGDYPLFRIDNPEAAEALNLKPEKHRGYSYKKLEPALHKIQSLAASADSVKPEKRNLVQKEILRTFTNLVSYLGLTRALQFARPSEAFAIRNPETLRALNLSSGQGPHSFWELMDRAEFLARVLEDVGAKPDSLRSVVENEVVLLSRSMYLQSQAVQISLWTIFPDPGTEKWSSPSEVVANPARMQLYHDEVGFLAAMTSAYRSGNGIDFDARASDYRKAMLRRAPAQLEKTRFPLEILNNRLEPLFLSTVVFWLCLFTSFLFFLWPRRGLYVTAFSLAGLAWFFLAASITARILIMRRPPVTSLYETFPFVTAISIAVALMLERKSRQGIALLTSAILGVVLLSIAGRYAADGDTLQMLVAVLNSNFWLSTHVLCVTTGYAACLLAGALGHARLVRSALAPSANIKEIDRMVFGTVCFGLLFSFIGTVLGGIWADQSWGRFWGWDPKENGALLIVIWCAILLHAKQWGLIREAVFAGGTVVGAILVSLAWLGVNLLNVGLHSYGFTTGAAVKLFSYVGAEILFLLIIWLAFLIQGKRKNPSKDLPTTTKP